MAAFASAGGDERFPADVKKSRAAKKADLENSLVESEEILAYRECHIPEFYHNKDTVHNFATKVDQPEALLRIFEGHVHFLEHKVSEQINQLV